MTTVLTYRRRLGLSFGVRALALLCAATGIGSGAALALPIQGASTSIVDVDRDGVPDNIRVVTAPTPAVQVVSGANGAVLATLSGRAGEAFGSATRTFGDINGDGHPELLVYADAATSPQAGAVYLFDLRTGLELWRLPIADTTPPLTGATAPPSTLDLQPEFSVIPDQTGDGVPDVVVGGSTNTQGGSTGAVVVLVDGRTGARLALRQMSFAAAVSIVSATVPGRIYRPTDLDGSGVVNLDDLVLYLSATVNGLSSADVNGDGQINSADASLIVQDITDRQRVVLNASDSLPQGGNGVAGSGPGGGAGTWAGGGANNALTTGGITLLPAPYAGPPNGCDYGFTLGWQRQADGSVLNDEFPFEPIRPGPLVPGEDYPFFFTQEVRDSLRVGGTWVHRGRVPLGTTIGGNGYLPISGTILRWDVGAGYRYSQYQGDQGLLRWLDGFLPLGDETIINVETGVRLRRPEILNPFTGIVRVWFWVTIQPPANATVPVPPGEQPTLPSPVTLCYSYDYNVLPLCWGLEVKRVSNYSRTNICANVFSPDQPIIVSASVVGVDAPPGAADRFEWIVKYYTLDGVVDASTRRGSSSSGVLRLTPPKNTGSIDIWVTNSPTTGVCDPNPSEKFTLTLSVDADNDGVPDACEAGTAQPPSSTRFCTSPKNRDTDGDGFLDGIELALGSDPCNRASVPSNLGDTDGDGLTDYDEVIVHRTNPNLFDTDGDGASDFAEVELRRWQQLGEAAFAFAPALRGVPLFNPLDARSLGGPLADGFTSAYQAFDRDHDQLFDPWEEIVGLDPSNPDEDGDGVNDGFVLNWGYYGSTPTLPRPGVVPPQALDSDNDGIPDDMETALGTDIYSQDSDGDGLPDGYELNNGYNPTGTDTDGNGINDGDEDRDSDGLNEADEYSYGTDANRADTDNDGRSDGWEVNNRRNPTSSEDANTPLGEVGIGQIEILAGIGSDGGELRRYYNNCPAFWANTYSMTILGGHTNLVVTAIPKSISKGPNVSTYYTHNQRAFVLPAGKAFRIRVQRMDCKVYEYRSQIGTCERDVEAERILRRYHAYQAGIIYRGGEGVVILDDHGRDIPPFFQRPVVTQQNPLPRLPSDTPTGHPLDHLELLDPHDPATITTILYTPRISVRDLRDWGPLGVPNPLPDRLDATVQNKDLLNGFTQLTDKARELAGAVTDGASPCVVRLDFGDATPPPALGATGRFPKVVFKVERKEFLHYSRGGGSLPADVGGKFLDLIPNSRGEAKIYNYVRDDLLLPDLPLYEGQYWRYYAPARDEENEWLSGVPHNNDYQRLMRQYRSAKIYVPPSDYKARGFNESVFQLGNPGIPTGFPGGLTLIDWMRRSIPVDPYNWYYGGPLENARIANSMEMLNRLDDGEETHMVITAETGWHGILAGSRPWKLRRPPIVLVHGITGNVAINGNYYFDKRVWDTGPVSGLITSTGQITPEQLSAEQGTPPILTRLYRVDYRPVNMKGFDKALPYLESTIGKALSDYRSGQASLVPRVQEKFAITQVDAVGHSMGGQILKLYISDIQGYSRPAGCDQFTDRTYQYLDPSSWYAGKIRRIATIGTPHTGSAQSNLMWYAVRPPDIARGFGIELDRIESFIKTSVWILDYPEMHQLMPSVHPRDYGGSDFGGRLDYVLRWNTLERNAYRYNSLAQVSAEYRAPEAVRDLGHFSEANLALKNAKYPNIYASELEYDRETGVYDARFLDTKVPWIPVAATVQHPYTGVRFGGSDWGPYLLDLLPGIDQNPNTTQLAYFMDRAQEEWLREHGYPFSRAVQSMDYRIAQSRTPGAATNSASLHHDQSDGVVNFWSQRNLTEPPPDPYYPWGGGWRCPNPAFWRPLTFDNVGHSKSVVETRANVSFRETDYRPIAAIIMDRLSKPRTPEYWHPWPLGGYIPLPNEPR